MADGGDTDGGNEEPYFPYRDDASFELARDRTRALYPLDEDPGVALLRKTHDAGIKEVGAELYRRFLSRVVAGLKTAMAREMESVLERIPIPPGERPLRYHPDAGKSVPADDDEGAPPHRTEDLLRRMFFQYAETLANTYMVAELRGGFLEAALARHRDEDSDTDEELRNVPFVRLSQRALMSKEALMRVTGDRSEPMHVYIREHMSEITGALLNL